MGFDRNRTGARFARHLAFAVVAASLTLVLSATAAAGPHPSIRSIPHGIADVCVKPRLPDRARCLSKLVTKPNSRRPLASATPPATAYSPAQMRHGYGFDAIGCYPGCGQGQTIAIVDAFDAPHIASDLATFDSQYGLPAPPSFSKVTPPGQSAPAYDSGWEEEIALDVEWAHAMAPGASIVLVESADNTFANLYGAVDYAAANANVVSMSWGGGEYASELSDDGHFNHPAVAFLASAGDSGHVTDYPAASPLVTAVSGTSLTLDTAGNRTGETAWSCSSSLSCNWYGGTGGDTSPYESLPQYQSSFTNPSGSKISAITGTKRGYGDVSYNADPNTGVAIYDSGQGGWLQIGGTSAGAPQWSALVAIVKAGKGGAAIADSDLYNAAAGSAYGQNYHDVTSGQNGSCGTACNAAAGWDEPTGLGSPIANALSSTLGAPPPPKLAFSGLGTTFSAGGSTTGAVQLLNPDGTPHTNDGTSAIAVSLSSSSVSGSFIPTSVTIAPGASTSSSFSYSDTKAGDATLSAAASGYGTGTQIETVTAGPATALTVSPTSATVGAGASQVFTANATDQYGNAADARSTAWTTSVPGGSVTSPGSSTTFTAPSAGSSTGAVTATLGSLTSSANVTVSPSPIFNGGFESGNFSGWTIGGGHPNPVVVRAQAHNSTYSAQLGYTASSGEPKGDSWIQQQFTVPASGGTLSFYVWEFTTDSVRYDWQTCQIRNTSGSTLATIFKEAANGQAWVQKSTSLNNWKGQKVAVWCNVHEDGYGDQTYMYADDFAVQ